MVKNCRPLPGLLARVWGGEGLAPGRGPCMGERAPSPVQASTVNEDQGPSTANTSSWKKSRCRKNRHQKFLQGHGHRPPRLGRVLLLQNDKIRPHFLLKLFFCEM